MSEDAKREEWLDALNPPKDETPPGVRAQVVGIMSEKTTPGEVEEISKMPGVDVDIIEIRGKPRAKITLRSLFLPKSKKKE